MAEHSEPSEQSQVNRRAFLKLSLLTGVGLAFFPSGSRQKSA